ncbi:MAG: ATP phosphoribosyltransferase regulatory subunit [Butyrivibrio sp.]|nr:ATP phosphoribosyltransferase regulatory subunit [Butyrivibrio sp.]
MKNQLLHTPEGVRDIYNEEYSDRLVLQDRLRKVINSYGYQDIKTPGFEFFDIFNKERGSVASKNMFKFFDREGNTLVLRPDMTPSIARCAAKYFANTEDAIRLCYLGDTYINNSRYQGRLKETTQAGCELIGDASIEADAEMIALLIESILSSGLTEFQVEVGHIGFFKGLVNEAGLDAEGESVLREVILNKNIFRISDVLKNTNVSESVEECLNMLPTLFGDIDVLEKAKLLAGNSISLDAIEHLLKVYEIIKAYGFEKYVTFDLGMLSELDYYTGVIFKAYTYDVGEPIANGGRYDKLIGQFGKECASIGFCITIDFLHQAVMRQNIDIDSRKQLKLLVYGSENLVKAISIAKDMRSRGIAVEMMKNIPADSADKYDEIISVE